MSCKWWHTASAKTTAGVGVTRGETEAIGAMPGGAVLDAPNLDAPRSESPERKAYLEAKIDQIDPSWLHGLIESPGFSRTDAMTILEAARKNAIEKLAFRDYNTLKELDGAIAAINANTLKHSADVTVMATRIGKEIGADAFTARLAGMAAGYHDADKDNTNFVYHAKHSSDFAKQSLRETGLSNDSKEIAAIAQAINEHMVFDSAVVNDPRSFMNTMLMGEVARIGLMTDDEAREKALRFLMKDTLQRSDKDLTTVRAFLDQRREAFAKDPKDFASVIGERFAGKEIAYPQPTSMQAQIVNEAATISNEDMNDFVSALRYSQRGTLRDALLDVAEKKRKEEARREDERLGERMRLASLLTLHADSSLLPSDVKKIVTIHQKQWGREGQEPIAVSMSSLLGGAYSYQGTGVDAVNSMHIPVVKEAAQTELELGREFRLAWQRQTFERWERATIREKERPPDTPQAKESQQDRARRRKKFERDPFGDALSREEMIAHQPSSEEGAYAEFARQYDDFIRANAHRRKKLFQMDEQLN